MWRRASKSKLYWIIKLILIRKNAKNVIEKQVFSLLKIYDLLVTYAWQETLGRFFFHRKWQFVLSRSQNILLTNIVIENFLRQISYKYSWQCNYYFFTNQTYLFFFFSWAFVAISFCRRWNQIGTSNLICLKKKLSSKKLLRIRRIAKPGEITFVNGPF